MTVIIEPTSPQNLLLEAYELFLYVYGKTNYKLPDLVYSFHSIAETLVTHAACIGLDQRLRCLV